jgi:glycosyltransferase involved in cell wall biosynthesis
VSRHRIPWNYGGKVIGTLHDLIIVEFDGVVSTRSRQNERETIRRWLESSAQIVVLADATVAALGRLYGTRPERVSVIPLSGRHRRPPAGELHGSWPFARRPYLLCPTNTSPHKNLDVLLTGVGIWGAKAPLVLTGTGTDFWAWSGARPRQLRRIATRAGLERNRTLFPLGYVEDSAYDALLEGAWAVVVPTLAEGAGLPVIEAMHGGIPVVSSDIPIAHEMVERTGGQVLWFDASSPADLAARLADLEGNYSDYKAMAVAQVKRLRARSWEEVASEYVELMVPASKREKEGDR